MNKSIAAAVLVVVVAAVFAVKWFFFPSIKDDYFSTAQRSLHQVPSGLVVVRPTHFPKSWRTGVTYDSVKVSGKEVWRIMGRNVPLGEVLAVAYDKNADRIVLPADAPKTNFDFLVTTSGDQRKQLQNAIRKKLGYVAHTEIRDQDVLAIKVQDASLPGLTNSDNDAKQNVNFDKGKLYFTHMQLKDLTGGLEEALKKPIVDRTELTNFYNFSVNMTPQLQRQLQNESNAVIAVKNILGAWGLRLVPDSDRVEVLVVRDAS